MSSCSAYASVAGHPASPFFIAAANKRAISLQCPSQCVHLFRVSSLDPPLINQAIPNFLADFVDDPNVKRFLNVSE